MRMASLQKQRGIALITVLIIVALVSLIATGMSSALYMNMNRTSNLLDADQAQQYARSAEEFAIQILKKSFEKDDKKVYLGQPWATKGMTFPIDNGVMTGEIRDLQSCFNLNSLVPSKKGDPNKSFEPSRPDSLGKKVFKNLVREAGVQMDESPDPSETLSAALIDWMDGDQNPTGMEGAEDVYYSGLKVPYRTADQPLANVRELRAIKGFSAKVYDALKPYVCVLPSPDVLTINVNTVSSENTAVLAALYESNGAMAAQAILQARPEKGFDDLGTATGAAGAQAKLLTATEAGGQGRPAPLLAVTSNYFLFKAHVVLGGGEARIESIIKRDGDQYRVLSRSFGAEDDEQR